MTEILQDRAPKSVPGHPLGLGVTCMHDFLLHGFLGAPPELNIKGAHWAETTKCSRRCLNNSLQCPCGPLSIL
jgi:hypothetical protein